MNLKRTPLLVLSLLTAWTPLQAQDPSGSPWPRVKAGTVVAYQSKITMDQTFQVGTREMKNLIEIQADTTYKVVKVKDDGSWTLHLTHGHMSGTVDGPMGKFDFDSRKGSEQPLAKEIMADVGKTFVVTIGPRGQVLSACPLVDGKPGKADEHKKETLQFEIPQFPAAPVKVGDPWSPKVGVHECIPGGECMELLTTCTLTSLKKTELTLETRAQDKKEKPKATVRCTMVLSRTDGLPVSIKGSGTMKAKMQSATLIQSLTSKVTRKR